MPVRKNEPQLDHGRESEAIPFLSSSSEPISKKISSKRRWVVANLCWAAHILLFIINTTWFTLNLDESRRRQTSLDKAGLYEPDEAPIKMERVKWELPLGKKSPFTSLDRKTADAAWQTISMDSWLGWIKIPKAKVQRMDQESVEFSDGSGYFFGIDVFHQLHCLDYIRKNTIMYNHLYPNLTEEEEVPREYHLPHCIDSIRLSLQCHADMTLIPQRWADGWLEPWAVWQNRHQCRNFEALRDWTREQRPSTRGLVHPQLGPVVSGHLNLSALPIYQEEHDEIDI